MLNTETTNINTNRYKVADIWSLVDVSKNGQAIFPPADVVIGGFPCQDFSMAGRRLGFANDGRGTLYKCLVYVINQVKPKVFVAENVQGLLTINGGDSMRQIIDELSNLGYDVSYELVNSAMFGIPQMRKRVIIMGVLRIGRRRPLLCDKWNILKHNKVQCHIGEYFKHLDEPTETSDPEQRMLSKAKRLSSKCQGQAEVKMDGFAPTIRANHHGNIEFRRYATTTSEAGASGLPERRLTVREVALAQTFPPNFKLCTTTTTKAYRYIGNAVPPLLSYIIADHVANILKTYF